MSELPHNQPNDYTDSEIRIRPLVIFLAATLVVTLVTLVFIHYLFNSYAREMTTDGGMTMSQLDALIESNRPTNAVVEGMGDAAEAMRQLRADEDARLNHYRMKEGDLVQIPIERAMEAVVARGLPVRDEAAAAATAATETPVDAGKRVFTELGCIACHGAVAGALGPSLNGVYGHDVELADGTKVVADEAYIRNSILEPMSQLVAGYAPVMPVFKGIVTDEQLDQLVAYIKSLSDR